MSPMRTRCESSMRSLASFVTHEVTNVGSDRHQLKELAEAARDALGTEKLTAIADRGYYNGEQITVADLLSEKAPNHVRLEVFSS